VLADAEGQVPVRVAVDAELEGRLEDVLVAVRRRVEEAHGLAGADLPSAQLQVLGGRPAELDHWSRPAGHLLHRAAHEPRVAA
jgi:hypothetical protein